MPLCDALVRAMQAVDASSFRLGGDGLWLLTGADLRQAAREYDAALALLPPGLRERVVEEQEAFALVAHRWLARYNHSLEDRLRGYLAIGRALGFEYPWPVVAVLGILQVKGGVRRSEVIRLAGAAVPALGDVGDWMQDMFRRTNRAVFADSVPTALLALRCCSLRSRGDPELAEAMLSGPFLPAMDVETRKLARGLYDALGIACGDERFRALAELTERHFEREQAVFTAGMGSVRSGMGPAWSALRQRFTRLSSILAPTAHRGKFRFSRYALPKDFDVRDHRARAEHFGRAFVVAITTSVEAYAVAVREVQRRFRASPEGPRFAEGAAHLLAWERVSRAEC
ncbi:MAG: hypothetical protein H6Q89_3487 [Myxococcaceae bacterium]|nr:hypothetical protein [Myxococcaceae bacterium]